ncbi:MAG TPA: hypothetical protein VFA32_08275 [Dehalococcoidia bacterium]|jgi:hypothetical protein|nr:hypothetical protein [Dehalococcoidia bacterium]
MEKVLLIGYMQRDSSMLHALYQTGFLVKELAGRLWGWPGLNKVRDEQPDLILLEEELVQVMPWMCWLPCAMVPPLPL